MRRRQLFEIEDQPWCPGVLRDGVTDLIVLHSSIWRQYASAARRLARALEACGQTRVVDLCSGGGGPWLHLLPALQKECPSPVELVLTDLFPNQDAASRVSRSTGGRITYFPEPVNATSLPRELSGFRTLFSSFHHFPPDKARAILADAVKNRQGIAVFEFTHRSVPFLLAMGLMPPGILALTPLVRPFKWQRLFWTYVIPAIPAVTWFDGMVSCLRTYSPADLRKLVQGLDGYDWDIGEEIQLPFRGIITRLIGLPRA